MRPTIREISIIPLGLGKYEITAAGKFGRENFSFNYCYDSNPELTMERIFRTEQHSPEIEPYTSQIARSFMELRKSLSYMVEPVYENLPVRHRISFYDQKQRVKIALNGLTFLIRPAYSAHIEPTVSGLLKAEQKIIDRDDFLARYNSPTLAEEFYEILREGVEIETYSFRGPMGYFDHSLVPGAAYKIAVQDKSLGKPFERDETIAHELLHAHFARNGAPGSSMKHIEENAVEYETSRFIRKYRHLVFPIGNALKPSSKILLRDAEILSKP